MAVQTDEKEEIVIEELVWEAEILLKKVGSKKDLKEKWKVLKHTLYDGSEKLKHVVPKGKHL